MNTTQKEINFAKNYLKMTEDERALFLTIMDMTIGNPDRREFAKTWTGKVKDLPAALAQI